MSDPRRRAVRAVAAAAASAVAAALPAHGPDPLRTTLIIVPLVVAALAEIAHWAASRGGRRTPASVAAGEAIALGVLIAAALGRGHLGLASHGRVEAVLVAGLVLLLAHRVGWILMALRPALRAPGWPPIPFLLLPLVVYLALIPWSSSRRQPGGDEPHYLLITHSLAFDLDADLTDNYARGDSLRFVDRRLKPQPGDPVGANGRLWSRHNLLLPMVLAPAYRVAGPVGALATMALLSALLAWISLRLARRYVPDQPDACLAAYAVLSFASPLLLYSYQVWVEVPAALLTALALDRIFELERPETRRRDVWILLGTLALLPLLKLRFLVTAASLLAVGFWRAPRRRLLVAATELALVGGAILLFNRAVFGNPFKYHEVDSLRAYLRPPIDYAVGILGLFWDAAFGLFAAAPIWLLLLPGMLLLVRGARRIGGDLMVVALPLVLLVGPRLEWYGGWSPPFRYGVVLLPLLTAALVPPLALHRRAGMRPALAALAALTLVMSMLWVAEPGWTYNPANGRGHILDFLSTRQGVDVARLFPSSARPRAATWLWPVATLLGAGLLLWRVRAGSRGSAVGGMAGLLVGACAFAILPHALPSRVIEFEDPQVRKSGGRLYPPLWIVARTRFRGGWNLSAGEAIEAPIVSGGQRLSMTLDLRPPAAAGTDLVVRSGETEVAVRRLSRGADWRSERFDALPWTAGTPLALELRWTRDGVPKRRVEVLLDRARLEWSD